MTDRGGEPGSYSAGDDLAGTPVGDWPESRGWLPRRRRPWSGRALVAATIVSWAAFAVVVIELAPEHWTSYVAFYASLALALFVTGSLLSFLLSFVVFASPSHRGNLGRSLLQGGVTALVLLIGAALQAGRLLGAPQLAFLLVAWLIGQAVALHRRQID